MKTLRIISFAALFMAFASMSFAQAKTETFKVSGNCGMCKSKIEKAAKDAGAKSATWDVETKILTVSYKSSSTNTAKIQEKIAGVGYDNAGFKTTDEAYNKLHGCCKYDREAVNKNESCCKNGKCDIQACKDAGCCQDGKCDMSVCKEKGCCKDSEKCREMGCCGHEGAMGANAKMDCCKKGVDGKTTMNCSKDDKGCCSKKATTQQ